MSIFSYTFDNRILNSKNDCLNWLRAVLPLAGYTIIDDYNQDANNDFIVGRCSYGADTYDTISIVFNLAYATSTYFDFNRRLVFNYNATTKNASFFSSYTTGQRLYYNQNNLNTQIANGSDGKFFCITQSSSFAYNGYHGTFYPSWANQAFIDQNTTCKICMPYQASLTPLWQIGLLSPFINNSSNNTTNLCYHMINPSFSSSIGLTFPFLKNLLLYHGNSSSNLLSIVAQLSDSIRIGLKGNIGTQASFLGETFVCINSNDGLWIQIA